MSVSAQFRTRCTPSSPAAVPISTGAPCLVSSADRCSMSSVRACRGMVCLGTCPALVLARPVMLPVLCSPSGCAGGWGLHRRGIQGAPGVGQVMPANSEAQEKGVFRGSYHHTHPLFPAKNTPPPLSISKISPKNKKDPYKGSVFCAILALQALKGRNL